MLFRLKKALKPPLLSHQHLSFTRERVVLCLMWDVVSYDVKLNHHLKLNAETDNMKPCKNMGRVGLKLFDSSSVLLPKNVSQRIDSFKIFSIDKMLMCKDITTSSRIAISAQLRFSASIVLFSIWLVKPLLHGIKLRVVGCAVFPLLKCSATTPDIAAARTAFTFNSNN